METMKKLSRNEDSFVDFIVLINLHSCLLNWDIFTAFFMSMIFVMLLWLLMFFFSVFHLDRIEFLCAKSTNCSGLNFKLSPIKWNYCCAACMMMPLLLLLLLVMAPNLVARFSLVLHALHYSFFILFYFLFLSVSNFSFDSKCAGKNLLITFCSALLFLCDFDPQWQIFVV